MHLHLSGHLRHKLGARPHNYSDLKYCVFSVRKDTEGTMVIYSLKYQSTWEVELVTYQVIQAETWQLSLYPNQSQVGPLKPTHGSVEKQIREVIACQRKVLKSMINTYTYASHSELWLQRLPYAHESTADVWGTVLEFHGHVVQRLPSTGNKLKEAKTEVNYHKRKRYPQMGIN